MTATHHRLAGNIVRETRTSALSSLVVLTCVLVSIPPARALTDEEILRDFRFNFYTPGARAMALGGAFVGIADDATAADANPAGLCNLTGGQVFVELGYSGKDNRGSVQSDVGSLDVNPVTGARDLPYLALNAQSQSSGSAAADFLAFVWPMVVGPEGRRLALSAGRQVILSEDRTLNHTQSQFSFASYPNTVSDGQVVAYSVLAPLTGSLSSEVVYWNVSAAYQVHPDFSIGATVSYATLAMDAGTSTQVIDPAQLFVDPTHPRLPARQSTDFYDTRIDGNDSGFAYSLGFEWHPNSTFRSGESPWRFGVVYQKGVSFSVPESSTLNGLTYASFDTSVVVPDRYSLGASYALGKRWLFALQFQRIEYADQLAGYRSGVNFITSERVAEGSYTTNPNVPVTFDVDNGIFFRAGAEYLVPLGGGDGKDLAIRGGYYRSPDDRIRMTQFDATDAAVNAMYLGAFPQGGAANHFTTGLGYTFGASTFNLAIDYSGEGSRIVGSYVWTMGAKKKTS